MTLHDYWVVKIFDSALWAAWFIYFAARGIVSRKPFLTPSKWFWVFLLIIELPKCVHVKYLANSNDVGLIDWFSFIVLMLLLLFFWNILNGYIVFGITEESFREALTSSLKISKLKYKEDLNGIHLKSHRLILKAFVFMGIGITRWRGNQFKKSDEKLLPNLKMELAKPQAEFNSTPVLISFVMAALVIFGLLLELSMFQMTGNLKTLF
jgi:hypothetical protein